MTHTPLIINGSAVKGTKFLGVHITDDLTTNTTSLVKKAQ